MSISICKQVNCPLYGNRIVQGSGAKNGILFIGEAPGEFEEAYQQAFIGTAGRLLRNLIAKSKLDRYPNYFSNVVLCRPTSSDKNCNTINRTPTKEEITYCRPNIESVIVDVRPKAIVLCGSIAAKSLKNYNFDPRLEILHPSYLSRIGGASSDLYWVTLYKLKDFKCQIESVKYFHYGSGYLDGFDSHSDGSIKIYGCRI